MSEMSNEAIQAQIRDRGLKVGNSVHVQTSAASVGGTGPLFTDANGLLVAGFTTSTALPLVSGVNSTAASVLDVRGSATGTANDLMHLTLVAGANATAVIAGYYRIDVTDAAGVVTTGSYYAPFYTLG